MKSSNYLVCLIPLIAACALHAQKAPAKPSAPVASAPAAPATTSGTASAHAPQVPVDETTTPGSAHYELGPDDQIKVWVLGADEIPPDKPFRVSPEGDLDLPVVGRVHVAGLTIDQLKNTLTERFSKELLHPQVSVDIVDFGSQPVSVVGAFNHPGVFQLRGHKTLAEVISLAEGLRQDAGWRITISRQIANGPLPLPNARPDASGKFSVGEIRVKQWLAGDDPADNIQILPHDVITATIAQAVYVMGDVKKAGEVPLKDSDSISVLQALASAEGLGQAAAPQRARIVRLSPNSTARLEIPVDLKKIQNGKGEDLAMRPNDILVVPDSSSEKAAIRMTEAAIQTLTGVVIWHSY